MKYFIVAGEPSGDLHGSNLIKGLNKFDKNAEVTCYGGDLMQQEGGIVKKHYREMAFMGIVEVVKNIGKIKKNFKDCERHLLECDPDVVIFIDYPGFNLKMAHFAKKHNYKVLYYISPKVWAWKTSRIKYLKRYVDRLFCILPFEVDFFKKHDYEVEYVGNPLMDAIDSSIKNPINREEFIKKNNLKDKPIITLMAGSRKMEIEKCLPEMMEAAKDFPNYQFVIAGAPSIDKDLYQNIIKDSNIHLTYNQTYDLLSVSEAAVVTSGTATLETALLEVPQVVMYKILKSTYYIGQMFFKLEFFSLVNLILGYEAVKELLQFNLASDIKEELNKMLNDRAYRSSMLQSYKKLKEIIGEPGASERVAKRTVQLVTSFNG